MSSSQVKSPAHTDQYFTWLAPVTIRKVRERAVVKEHGTRVEFSIAGISYADFDRRDEIWLPSIGMYFNMARVFSIACDNTYLSQAFEHFVPFLVQIEYKISENFYTLAKQRKIWFPMDFGVNLACIGKSTVTTEISLHDGKNPRSPALVYTRFKQSKVNKETRKSAPLSESFLDKYLSYSDASKEMKPLVVPKSVPGKAFSFPFMTRFSDTDANGHLNNTKYLMLCLDCAAVATLRGGYLPGFTGDISVRRVELVKCCYLQECKAGETVTVSVWQDETSLQDVLQFLMMKDDRQLFYCWMQFYPSYPVSKL